MGLKKLNGDNYHSWKFNMELLLQGKDLWDYVDGTEKLDSEATDAEKKKWKKGDNQARSNICLSVQENIQIYVRGSKTSKEAWDSLSKHFQENTLSAMVHWRRQLYGAKMSDASSMEAHLNNLKTIAEHLEAVDDAVSEKDLVMILMTSLPESYDNLITTLETLKLEQLTWNYVRDRCVAEYDRKNKKTGGEKKRDDALLTGGGNGGSGRFNSNSSPPWKKGAKGGKGNKDKECHYCKKKGHIRRDCFDWKKIQEQDTAKLAVEKVNGEMIEFESEFALFSPTTTDHEIEGIVNFTDAKEMEATEEAGSMEEVNFNQDVLSVVEDAPVKFAAPDDKDMSPSFSSEFALKVDDSNSVGEDWWVDSGASEHMSFDENDFINYKEFDEKVRINLADNSFLLAHGKGDVNLRLYDVKRKVDVTLENTLYVPDIKNRLFSISSAVEDGGSITISKDSVILNKNGKSAEIGHKHGKLYKLNLEPEHRCCLGVVKESTSLWHQRFGHLNDTDLMMLKSKDLVNGLNLQGSGKEVGVCEGCVMGKSKRFSFPKQSESKTTKPLQLIHSDVCGPMHVPSVGGSRYFVTFTDDYSRYGTVYMLKTKDQVYNTFVEYVDLVENQLNLKVKKFRSDGGGEYISNDIKNFCKSRGIFIEGSMPYTPQQNAVSERMNRTLVEMARSMLFHANLPLELWAEAVSTASYIRNRCPTSSFKGATPYERWTGVKPDVSNLRVFGCDVYVHVPDQVRRKLEKKAIKAVFVGYPAGKKGYKIYNPKTKRFAFSRDASFVENSFSSCTLAGQGTLAGQAEFYTFDTSLVHPESTDAVEVESESIPGEGEEEYDIVIEDDKEIVREDDVVIDLEDDHVTVNGVTADVTEENVTNSSRSRRMPDYYGDRVFLATDGDDPRTVKQAMRSPAAMQWKDAMESEYKALMKHETWKLVDLPDGANLVGCKWVYKTKRTASGEIDRYKSRLVAQGYSQEKGIDFDEVFAPVAKYKSIRTVLAIANQLDLDIHQMDVKSAFLYGDLTEDIYMRQPEGFVDKDNPDKVCKLRKTLYGLKQSARRWNKKIDQYLKSSNYKQSTADPCIYYRMEVVNGKNIIMIIVVYVDDTILLSNDTKTIIAEKKGLSERFEMDDRGELHFILGMEVKRDRKMKKLTICQKEYLKNVLARFGMQDCKQVSTPMETNKCFAKMSEGEEAADMRLYQSAIGSLNYAAVATRPDLSTAVGKLSQHMTNPSSDHWAGVKRVLRYVKGTLDYGLEFTYSDSFFLRGFSDADWAGCTDSRKSTSGSIFQLGNSTVSWSSKKQSVVALSSTEAEYVALCSASQEVVWLRNLLKEIGFPQLNSTLVYEDNQGAMCLAKDPKDHSRTKHIDIKYHYTRELVAKKILQLEYVPTGEMIADTLTKSLPKPKFQKFRSAMGVHPML